MLPRISSGLNEEEEDDDDEDEDEDDDDDDDDDDLFGGIEAYRISGIGFASSLGGTVLALPMQLRRIAQRRLIVILFVGSFSSIAETISHSSCE